MTRRSTAYIAILILLAIIAAAGALFCTVWPDIQGPFTDRAGYEAWQSVLIQVAIVAGVGALILLGVRDLVFTAERDRLQERHEAG